MHSNLLRLGVVAIVAFVSACDDNKLVRMCGDDSDCAPGFTCNEDGRCVCTSSTACALNEMCNAVGQCQVRVGCETSLECPRGQFCDRPSGNCLDLDRCTEDVQCALGEICDSVRFKCVPGCRDVGDCALGGICECEDSSSSCALKQCKVGPCGDDSYCKYGEVCVAEQEGDEKRCVRDERGPFCDPCQIVAGSDYCPAGPEDSNFCLIDTSKGFGSYFCGVDCQVNEECPWGFGCHDVLILTEQTCGGVNSCPLRQIECTKDSDCRGGTCDVEAGKCRAICAAGEGDVQGFCTCMEDTDCPRDSCDSFTQRCKLSQKSCDPNVENDCGTIYCKHVKDPRTAVEIGYCQIGRNCAPEEGVTCSEVREQ